MKAIIAWFARNGVAANLLMGLIIFAGLHSSFNLIRLQVFPDLEPDSVRISVPYRGSTPAETEEAIVIRIEEAIQDLEGIEKIVSTASEGSGTVLVEAQSGYSPRVLLNEIKNRVDSINTFPVEAERPNIEIPTRSDRVINVVVSGPLTERDLKRLGEQVRDEIANLPGVTQVGLQATRPYEIAVEVSEQTLQQFGLTFDQVTRAISTSSLDLSAGSIKTAGGDILLRTKGQAYVQDDFNKIVVLTREDGTRVTLGDIAHVNDGFDETPILARFNGKRAVMVDVHRVGDQNAIDLAEKVKAYVVEAGQRMPPGVELGFWQDRSERVYSRLKTLTDSAVFGGALVFMVLALFLRFSLAVWVSIGIPVSFLGALAIMPHFDVSINLITLFAFILVLGIVVDDAIVTGENVFKHMQRGESPLKAAIEGTQEVAVPVTFGVLTTVVAFIPLTMVEGFRGQIFLQIPMIVIPVLLFSLIESKLILPFHLQHCGHIGSGRRQNLNPLARGQRWFADGLERFIISFYRPILAWCMDRRYLTLTIFVAAFIVLGAFVASGRLRFVYFPRVPGDSATVTLTMPIGTPIETTAAHVNRMESAAFALQKKLEAEYGQPVIRNILSTSGGQIFGARRGSFRTGVQERGEVVVELDSAERREVDIDSNQVKDMLRKMIGTIPGAKEVSFRSSRVSGGSPIDIQLTGPSFDALSEVAKTIRTKLSEYPGVFDITDSFEAGKDELLLKLKPEAEHLGITVSTLARQVRHAFFGAEAQRIQRGRDDVRVMVRYPQDKRRSMASLETMRIRTPAGSEVPFHSVAEVVAGKSLPTITRIDRNRTLNVTADVQYDTADLAGIREDLEKAVLPRLVGPYPAMNFSLEGEAREQRDSFGSLTNGIAQVLIIIYAMLAIPFKSYLQPLIVMSVIPFGLLGAILGHLIMGLDISIMSVFGCVALAGVVINDSLVLVDYVNRRRREGMSLMEAVGIAGVARFRPILLTSLTTFAGLTPLLFEKSRQAQWLIPMAVSLAFGVLFATFITLLMVPVSYLILEDAKRGIRRYYGLPPDEAGEIPQKTAEDFPPMRRESVLAEVSLVDSVAREESRQEP